MITIYNKKKKKYFKNVKILTINTIRNKATISTKKDLESPYDRDKLSYPLDDLIIQLHNKQ